MQLMVKILMKICHYIISSTAYLEIIHTETNNFKRRGNANWLHLANYCLEYEFYASGEFKNLINNTKLFISLLQE